YVSELQRKDIKLKDVEIYAKAQSLGWINPDRAANEVMGEKKAHTHIPTEQIRVSFNNDDAGNLDDEEDSETN
ncbi:MAG TPA: hypothetical protein GX005_03610, partial [Bacteroidales bacterium]|nr:hypothetical protein [Bacteroidales bacterium]